jgi:hypothetical protein
MWYRAACVVMCCCTLAVCVGRADDVSVKTSSGGSVKVEVKPERKGLFTQFQEFRMNRPRMLPTKPSTTISAPTVVLERTEQIPAPLPAPKTVVKVEK